MVASMQGAKNKYQVDSNHPNNGSQQFEMKMWNEKVTQSTHDQTNKAEV